MTNIKKKFEMLVLRLENFDKMSENLDFTFKKLQNTHKYCTCLQYIKRGVNINAFQYIIIWTLPLEFERICLLFDLHLRLKKYLSLNEFTFKYTKVYHNTAIPEVMEHYDTILLVDNHHITILKERHGSTKITCLKEALAFMKAIGKEEDYSNG